MEYTRTLQAAVKRWGLKEIHRGILSYKGNRYVRAKRVTSLNQIKNLDDFTYTAEFNYARIDGGIGWISFEKTGMTKEEAIELQKIEFAHNRRLWDSRVMYLENGNELYKLIFDIEEN